jgi:hypothetical protein
MAVACDGLAGSADAAVPQAWPFPPRVGCLVRRPTPREVSTAPLMASTSGLSFPLDSSRVPQWRWHLRNPVTEFWFPAFTKKAWLILAIFRPVTNFFVATSLPGQYGSKKLCRNQHLSPFSFLLSLRSPRRLRPVHPRPRRPGIGETVAAPN